MHKPEILISLQVFRFHESESHIFRGWSVRESVHMCVINLAQNQEIVETSYNIFVICVEATSKFL